MRNAWKLDLLLVSMILCSIACSKGGGVGGVAGDLAAAPPAASVLLCPVPGERPITELVKSLTLPTGQCECATGVSGTSCGSGNYCGINGCISLPAGTTANNVVLPLASTPCPVVGEASLLGGTDYLTTSGACGCASAVPIQNCPTGQICDTTKGCVSALTTRRVFVSSIPFQPGTAYPGYNKAATSSTFNSIANADAACNDLGQNAVGVNTHWRAWIQLANSSTSITARNRLVPTYISGTDNRNVILMDGTAVSGPVGATGVGFDSSTHQGAISEDENGTAVPTTTTVWTGAGNADCSGWTSNATNGAANGQVGSTTSIISTWYNDVSQWCSDTTHRFYCIESDS